jgi:hypothetical protein
MAAKRKTPKPADEKSAATRLGEYGAKWMDVMFDQTATTLRKQSDLLKSYKGIDIVSDVQDVSATVFGIWYSGINKLLGKKP